MRYQILLVILLAGFFQLNAQKERPTRPQVEEKAAPSTSTQSTRPQVSNRLDKAPIEYVYAELIGTRRAFSNNITVIIDYGQDSKLFAVERIVDPRTGKPKVFNSMIDALNFMSENGWEFVQAYVASANNTNTFFWLLKRDKNYGKTPEAGRRN